MVAWALCARMQDASMYACRGEEEEEEDRFVFPSSASYLRCSRRTCGLRSRTTGTASSRASAARSSSSLSGLVGWWGGREGGRSTIWTRQGPRATHTGLTQAHREREGGGRGRRAAHTPPTHRHREADRGREGEREQPHMPRGTQLERGGEEAAIHEGRKRRTVLVGRALAPLLGVEAGEGEVWGLRFMGIVRPRSVTVYENSMKRVWPRLRS